MNLHSLSKTKKINSIQILGFILICLYFTTCHFHTGVGYFAKNVADLPF